MVGDKDFHRLEEVNSKAVDEDLHIVNVMSLPPSSSLRSDEYLLPTAYLKKEFSHV